MSYNQTYICDMRLLLGVIETKLNDFLQTYELYCVGTVVCCAVEIMHFYACHMCWRFLETCLKSLREILFITKNNL